MICVGQRLTRNTRLNQCDPPLGDMHGAGYCCAMKILPRLIAGLPCCYPFPRTPSSAAVRRRPTALARSVVTIVGSRGNFCTGAVIAPSLVLTVALRAPGRGLQDRRIWPDRDSQNCRMSNGSRFIPASTCRPCQAIARRPMSRCCSSRRQGQDASRARPAQHPDQRRQPLHHRRHRRDRARRRQERGTIRVAALVATGRPGTLQICLVDPVGQGARDGLGPAPEIPAGLFSRTRKAAP